METKKVIVCDLDGTLAPSKSSISSGMVEVLSHILERHQFAVVSGGTYDQFEKQFLSRLNFGPELLRNLYLFPNMGSAGYIYDHRSSSWKELYKEVLTKKEKDKIKKAINEGIKETGLNMSGAFGEIVEDRGSQITFSGRGQEAPISIKANWDPDRSKRTALAEILQNKLPEFTVRIGGTTSVDVTKKGVDKAYAIEKIKEILKVKDEDIYFVGDALYRGGNDEPVKSTGVDFIQEDGPDQTLELLSRYM